MNDIEPPKKSIYPDRYFNLLIRRKTPPKDYHWEIENYSFEEFIPKKWCNWARVQGIGGLVTLDVDFKDDPINQIKMIEDIEKNLPETRTKKTPNGGRHYEFLCDDLYKLLDKKNVITFVPTGAGELLGSGHYVVGEGSIVENIKGEEKSYELIKDIPRAKITPKQMHEGMKEYWPKPEEKKYDSTSPTTKPPSEICLGLAYAMGNKLPEGGRHKNVSPNFSIYTRNHPQRDELRRKFEQAQEMQGDTWGWDSPQYSNYNGGAIHKYFKEKGLGEIVKDCPCANRNEFQDAPSLDLVDFTKELEALSNTHEHIPNFKLVEEEMALLGNEYYAVRKFMAYLVESLGQYTFSFGVGKEHADNRVHAIIMAPKSRGKGRIKTIAKYHPSTREMNGARVNLEQLVGKRIETKKGGIKDFPGDLTYDCLIEDEAGALLNETEKNYSAIMHEERMALDPYRYNGVEKRLVENTNAVIIFSPIRNLKLIHPTNFEACFFDTGSSRRYFAFKIESKKMTLDSTYATVLSSASENELKNLMQKRGNEKKLTRVPTMTKEAVDEFVEWYRMWVSFVGLHPNHRVRYISRGLEHGSKQYFFRMIAILSYARGEEIVSIETVKLACRDTIHFLLETFSTYANHSKPSLSRDIWRSEDENECAVLEWLWFNGATSENSKIGIRDVQVRIEDIFGVNERQARSIYAKLKRKGVIFDSKGKHDSRVWLGFVPGDDSLIEWGETVWPDLVFFLKNKFKSGKSGIVQPPLSQLNYSVQPSNFSSLFSLENKENTERPLPTTTLATLTIGDPSNIPPTKTNISPKIDEKIPLLPALNVLKTRLENTKNGLSRSVIEEAVGVEVLLQAKRDGLVAEPRSGWICLPEQRPPKIDSIPFVVESEFVGDS